MITPFNGMKTPRMYLSETNEISFSERKVFITPKVSESEKKNLQD